MFQTLILATVMVIGQSTTDSKKSQKPPVQGRIVNQPVKPSGPLTHAYVKVNPPTRCFAGSTMIRVDGPWNNPNGIVWRRINNWSELSTAETKAIEKFEAEPFNRRR